MNSKRKQTSDVSSRILIPLYRYGCPNSGVQKNNKAVTVLFNFFFKQLLYFWHQDKLFVAENCWNLFFSVVNMKQYKPAM